MSSDDESRTSTLDTTISLADNYGDIKNPYAAKSQNTVLAAPVDESGLPSFRVLEEEDIPSISKEKIYDFPTEMAPSSHTHGNITNNGTITSESSASSGDSIVIVDGTSDEIKKSNIQFGSDNTFLKNDGTWSVPDGTYVLPEATSETLGGIKVGDNLSVEADGTLNVEATIYATEGEYDPETNRIATESTVDDAIGNIGHGVISAGGTTKTPTTISQSSGVVSVTYEDIAFPVTSVNGDTGDVVLTYSDVHALSEDTPIPQGTVTSVTISATSPVESSASAAQTTTAATTISLAAGYGDIQNPYVSKEQNRVLASPVDDSGLPTFRELEEDDIPSLHKNKIVDFPTEMTPSSHTHGSISNDGKINDPVTIANGDKLVISDASDSTAIKTSTIAFGDSATEYLTNSGIWKTPDYPVTSVNTKTGNVSLTYTDVGALPSDTFIPSKTSDLDNDSDFAVDASYVHTDNNFTTELKTKLEGLVQDDHKWNDVALSHSVVDTASDTYIPALLQTSDTSATLETATATPSGGKIVKWDTNSYLYSTTPSAGDNSTKVATTGYVDSAISSLGAVLNFKGTVADAQSLPSTGNTTGDIWVVTADSSEYIWTGSAWEELGQTLAGLVPDSRTINNKPLSADITLSTSDIGAQPEVNVVGLLKGSGNGVITNAVEGTDYQGPLPTTSGQGGKYLYTDGSGIAWANVSSVLPSQTGQAGKFLTTDGAAVSWANVGSGSALPSQTGQAGKFLTTDGTSPSWESVSLTPEIFWVTLTLSSQDNYLPSHTFLEIVAALNAGQLPLLKYGTSDVYIFDTYDPSNSLRFSRFDGNEGACFICSSQDVWTKEEISIQAAITANGILKSDGLGNITAATAGTDYLTSSALSDYMEKGVDYVTAGQKTGVTLGTKATAEGNNTAAIGNYSHAEGDNGYAIGENSHIEGKGTSADNTFETLTVTGDANTKVYTLPSGSSMPDLYSIVRYGDNYAYIKSIDGDNDQITISAAISTTALTAESIDYLPSGISFSTLRLTKGNGPKLTFGVGSHAEGTGTMAIGTASHSEGARSTSIGNYAHTEGTSSVAIGAASHAEGSSNTAHGSSSHVEGQYNVSRGKTQHVFGTWNYPDQVSCSVYEIPKGRMRGDANGDGFIDDDDLVMIDNYARNIDRDVDAAALWCMDLNNNGGINVTDTQQMTRYLSGLVSALTGVPTFADYHNNWTYVQVDSLTGYWTCDITITDDAADIASVKCHNLISYSVAGTTLTISVSAPPIKEGLVLVIKNSYEGGTKFSENIEIVGNGTANGKETNARTLDWLGNETLAGRLTLGAAPVNRMDAVTKAYADSKTSKRVEQNPAITAADGVFTWTIAGTGKVFDQFAVVSVYDIYGNVVYPNINVAAYGQVTITIADTDSAGTLAANKYYAVIIS